MAHLFGMANRRLVAASGVVLSSFFCTWLFAQQQALAGPRVGDKAPAFSLKTVDKGEARTLESFTRASGMKGAVVVFLSCKCPYVAQARAPLGDLAKQFGAKVAFVGLNANQNEKTDEIRSDAALNFPF